MYSVAIAWEGRARLALSCALAAVVLGIALAGGATVAAAVGAGHTEQVDVFNDGSQMLFGYNPAINADGRYEVFAAPDFAADGNRDLYRRDRVSKETTLVTVAYDGSEAPSPGHMQPNSSISATGGMIAFYDNASNLVPDDTNGTPDIFVRNMVTGVTQRVDVGPNGEQGDGSDSQDFLPAIDADGDKVAFSSNSGNLVAPSVVPGNYQIFVRDLVTSQTVLVSCDPAGHPVPSHSYFPALSTSGRWCAFLSDASNLTSVSIAGRHDYVRDLQAGTTELIDQALGGGVANGTGSNPSISGDGRYVAFHSYATDIVSTPTAGFAQTYVYDRLAHTTRLVSMNASGVAANADATYPQLSQDGRYLSFVSAASNLVPGLTGNGWTQAYRCDLSTGQLTVASVDDHNVLGNNNTWPAAISGDGQHVVFGTYAANLVPNDTNGGYDVFVRDLISTLPTVTLSMKPVQGQAGAVGVGQNATFTVAVSNPGALDLKSVPLSLAFDPTKWTFVSGLPSPDTTSGVGATWNDIGPLNAGGTTTITVTLQAIGSTGGHVSESTATVAGATDYYSDVATTTASSVGAAIVSPAVEIDANLWNAAKQPVSVGSSFALRISVDDVGDTTMTSLPASCTFDPAVLQPIAYSVPPSINHTGILRWTSLGSTGPLGGRSVIVTFTVLSQPPSKSTTVAVSSIGGVDEYGLVPQPVTFERSVMLASPALTVTLAPHPGGPATIRIGETAIFDLVVRNSGDTTLTGVSPRNGFDASCLAPLSASPPWTTRGLAQLGWAAVSSLAPGQSATVTVMYSAWASPPGLSAVTTASATGLDANAQTFTSNLATSGVTVATRTLAKLSTPSAPKSIKPNKWFYIKGTLNPPHVNGAALVLTIQVKSGKKWKTYKSYPLMLRSGRIAYSLRLKISKRGSYRVRAYHADADHLPSYSLYRSFLVK